MARIELLMSQRGNGKELERNIFSRRVRPRATVTPQRTHPPGSMVDEGLWSVLREVISAELLAVCDSRPGFLDRRPDHFEYQVQLVLRSRTREHRSAARHLVEYAPDAPGGKRVHSLDVGV